MARGVGLLRLLFTFGVCAGGFAFGPGLTAPTDEGAAQAICVGFLFLRFLRAVSFTFGRGLAAASLVAFIVFGRIRQIVLLVVSAPRMTLTGRGGVGRIRQVVAFVVGTAGMTFFGLCLILLRLILLFALLLAA